MNKKRRIRREHVITYLFIFILLSISIFGLYFINNQFTGFAVYEQSGQPDFDEGTYDNTYWNGSSVIFQLEELSLDDNTIALWHFNEDSGTNLVDSSVNSLNGTTQNEHWVSGKINNAYDFDGVDNYIVVGDDSIFDMTGPITIEFWIYPNDIITDQRLLHRRDMLEVKIKDGGISEFKWKGSSSGTDLKPTASLPGTGVWTHVASVLLGTTATLYINGEEVDSASNAGFVLKQSDNNLYFGVDHNLNKDYSGLIDEVRISNISRADEIENMFEGTYTSQIFDAGNEAVWNNVSWEGSNLNLSVRSCDDDACSGESWINVSDTSPQILSLDNLSYFQYKFLFETDDFSYSPELSSVTIDYAVLNTAPTITLVAPQDGANYDYNESLSLDFIAYDSDGNLDSCWYNVNDGNNIILTDCANTSFDVSGEGNYALNIYANDTQGEEAGDSASFNVDTLSIPSPPSNGGESSGGGGGSSSGAPRTPIIVGNISNIISNPGETKELSLSVKNGRFTFLQDCQVIGDGEHSDWFGSSETKGLAAGESYEFSFDLKIPEVSEPNTYNLSVKVVCGDLSKGVDFNLEIIEQKLSFDLIKVERITEEEIKIIYLLEELSGLEQSINNLQFLLFNSDNEKISEVSETRIVSADSKQEFEILIPIEPLLEGELSLLINMDSESYSTFTQEDIILGAPVSGFFIFGEKIRSSGNIISLILIVLFFVFTFFIVRKILKHRKKSKK